MAGFRSDFLSLLERRGFVHQCSDGAALDAAARTGRITAYIGFDCTAPSLHAGNLLGIMMLRHLQAAGHRAIAVVGGGTTRIGDPSFRDEARPLLGEAEIANNFARIAKSFRRFLRPGGGGGEALVLDNHDWLKGLNYLSFLREIGPHFSVNRMLSMDSVRLRLEREQSLSFLEFNYMVIQAYDFVHLHREYGCILQMGGADQWGNIVNGIELARRLDGAQLFALTTALLTTAAGAKMGKTKAGALWLDPDLCSPYAYWQYWRNAADADVGRFLRLFTELPLEEIARLEGLGGEEINEAKAILAHHATSLVHGEAAAREAARGAEAAFGGGGDPGGMPSFEVGAGEISGGFGLLTALVRAGLAASNSEARRLVRAGAVRVNDQPQSDEAHRLSRSEANAQGAIKLSAGKKRHALLKILP